MDQQLPDKRRPVDPPRAGQVPPSPRDESTSIARGLSIGTIHARNVYINVNHREETATVVEDRSTHATVVKEDHRTHVEAVATTYRPTTVSAPSYRPTAVVAPAASPGGVATVGCLVVASALLLAAVAFLAGFAVRAVTEPGDEETAAPTRQRGIPRTFADYLDRD